MEEWWIKDGVVVQSIIAVHVTQALKKLQPKVFMQLGIVESCSGKFEYDVELVKKRISLL